MEREELAEAAEGGRARRARAREGWGKPSKRLGGIGRGEQGPGGLRRGGAAGEDKMQLVSHLSKKLGND